MEEVSAAGSEKAQVRVGKALLLIAAIFLLREAKPVLAPVLVALVLTGVLLPPLHWLQRHGVNRYFGAGLLLMLLLAVLTLLGMLITQPAVDWWERTPGKLQQLMASVNRLSTSVPLLAQLHQPPTPALAPGPLQDKLTSEGVALTGTMLSNLGAFVFAAGATLILSFLLLVSERWILSHLLAALPDRRQRAKVLGALRKAQREISRYFTTMSLSNVCLGLATTAALWGIGLPNAVFWGTAAGLLNFIPYFGPVTTTILLLLTGVTSFTTLGAMLAPAGTFLLLNALESNLFSPWLVGQRLQIRQLTIFCSVLLWGWLWGVAGTLVAIPMLISIRCACRRRYRLLNIFLERNTDPPPSLAALLKSRHGAHPRRQHAPRQN
jgi:predicted PurR-regulated permease PerM